jgi:hypothetical protein
MSIMVITIMMMIGIANTGTSRFAKAAVAVSVRRARGTTPRKSVISVAILRNMKEYDSVPNFAALYVSRFETAKSWSFR